MLRAADRSAAWSPHIMRPRPTCCVAWTPWTSVVQPRCLQAEYCFTAEGTDKNPTAYSLRGLDAAVYYRSNGVLNCGHAVVRTLIIDSLKHWALEYQVDGFCFVNAETLVQGECPAPGSWVASSS